MDQSMYAAYVGILKKELIMALGCTEPIAVAYAAATASRTLGVPFERMEVYCSGNIIKNVKAVTVPNSGGMRGIDAAALLGAVGGDPSLVLSVLESVKPEHVQQVKELQSAGACKCLLAQNVPNLYIRVVLYAGEHSAEVEIIEKHTAITKIVKDGKLLQTAGKAEAKQEEDEDPRRLLSVEGILDFADSLLVEDVKEILDKQIACNTAISAEGLRGDYGAQIGRTLLESYPDSLHVRARARAAAGSDARMSGCPLPVVINSGSGNQGITVSLPVITYAEEMGASSEQLYRALAVSNLVAVLQKRYIGDLSAYCGAVCAACGSGAAITYLAGGTRQQVADTITNTIADIGGMICDGAKASCAAKIASSVEAALLAHEMSMKGRVFRPGEGLVKSDVEKTIQSIGKVARVGMHPTDVEILETMLED